MSATKKLRIPRFVSHQSLAHVTHNEALDVLDVVCQLSVLDKDLLVAPVRPPDGSRYIVGPNAVGAWRDRSRWVAAWLDGAWKFFEPQKGWVCYVRDEGKVYVFNGINWAIYDKFTGFLRSIDLANGVVQQTGINRAASTINRLAVSSSAVLLNTINNHMRTTINKRTVANDSSLTFQTNSSTRAIVGLIGSNDYVVRTTPNGSSFTTSLRAHPGLHGRVFIKQASRHHQSSLVPVVGPSLYDAHGSHWAFSQTTLVQGATSSSRHLIFLSMRSPVSTGGPLTGGLTLDFFAQTPYLWRGNTSNLGGFYVEFRFRIVSTPSPCDGFIGLCSQQGALPFPTRPTLNCIGVSWLRNGPLDTQTTLLFTSTTQTGATMGAPLPQPHFNSAPNGAFYEMRLLAEPNSQSITFHIQNLDTGASYETTINQSSWHMPSPTAFLAPRFYCHNGPAGGTASAGTISVMSVYAQNTSLSRRF